MGLLSDHAISGQNRIFSCYSCRCVSTSFGAQVSRLAICQIQRCHFQLNTNTFSPNYSPCPARMYKCSRIYLVKKLPTQPDLLPLKVPYSVSNFCLMTFASDFRTSGLVLNHFPPRTSADARMGKTILWFFQFYLSCQFASFLVPLPGQSPSDWNRMNSGSKIWSPWRPTQLTYRWWSAYQSLLG